MMAKLLWIEVELRGRGSAAGKISWPHAAPETLASPFGPVTFWCTTSSELQPLCTQGMVCCRESVLPLLG